jgi:hypothetical protein
MTPLMLACKLGHVSVCEMLIEMGANCEKKDKSGWTPLHYAVSRCRLKEWKIKRRITTHRDNSPPPASCRRHTKAYGGDIDTIDTILDQGVPHRKKDKVRGFASDFAITPPQRADRPPVVCFQLTPLHSRPSVRIEARRLGSLHGPRRG